MNLNKRLMILVAVAVTVLLPNIYSCAQKSVRSADPSTADTPFEPEAESNAEAYYHFTLSRMLYLDNRFADSLEELQTAEQLDPESGYLKYNLALMYISAGQMNEALAKLKESIDVDPDFAPSYTLLGKVYASSSNPDDREKSVSILEKAVNLDPEDAESLLFLAIMDTERGDYDAAEIKFQKITELYPDSERAYFFLGKLYYERGNYKKAEENYKRALDINPTFGSALIELAIVYEQEGRITESERIYKDVIVLYPNSLESYIRYGNFLFRVNRMEDAREDLESCI
jgi:tetratricopeptide (TPR) repeat protein